MNLAAGTAGIVLFATSVFMMQFAGKRFNAQSELMLRDMGRIIKEKPAADLDSDTAFVEHKETAGVWLFVIFLSLISTLLGGWIAITNFW